MKNMVKRTQEDKARVYCIDHGHAPYTTQFWGEVYCGRCGDKIGDVLASVFDLSNKMVIGCKTPNCKVCPKVMRSLKPFDKEIVRRLRANLKKEKIDLHDGVLNGIQFQ
jgi:hypothetical protein